MQVTDTFHHILVVELEAAWAAAVVTTVQHHPLHLRLMAHSLVPLVAATGIAAMATIAGIVNLMTVAGRTLVRSFSLSL